MIGADQIIQAEDEMSYIITAQGLIKPEILDGIILLK